MFYKIKNNILFRQYEGHGYITDNCEFGYRLLNDNQRYPGENFVSESGAVMLSRLTKSPRNIDEIILELMQIFVDVDFFAASLKVHEKQTDAMACGHEQRAGRA